MSDGQMIIGPNAFAGKPIHLLGPSLRQRGAKDSPFHRSVYQHLRSVLRMVAQLAANAVQNAASSIRYACGPQAGLRRAVCKRFFGFLLEGTLRSGSLRSNTGELNAGQIGHFFLPCRDVIGVELAQVGVPAGTGHHLHQFDRRSKEPSQLLGGFLDVQSRSKVFLLCGDSGRAIVRVADSCRNTPDGLHR